MRQVTILFPSNSLRLVRQSILRIRAENVEHRPHALFEMSKLLSPYRFECQDSANVVTGCPWCSRLILRGQFPESRTNFSTNLCIVRYVPMLRLMWSLHCWNALPVSYITRSFTTLVRIDVWEVANGITRNIISCIESEFKCHADIVTTRRRATSNDPSVHKVVKIFLWRHFIYDMTINFHLLKALSSFARVSNVL